MCTVEHFKSDYVAQKHRASFFDVATELSGPGAV
jgi:hypothetical protein